MHASKNRPRWSELPDRARCLIEDLAGGTVIAAENCAGGFSPGFASRLTLAGGRRVFAKAMDAEVWPSQLTMYRDEARVAAQLPPAVPAPRFLGLMEDERWVVLAFECVDGVEPTRPWRPAELARAVTAVGAMTAALTPSPLPLSREQPRIGGFAALSADAVLRGRLPASCGWAASRVDELAALEREGLAAARGESLVHFDALPHNILLTADRVVVVDWPHARLGAACIDLLMLLVSAAADGIDPEPFLAAQPLAAQTSPRQVTAVLAALTGFWLAGAVEDVPRGLEPIAAAKRGDGRGGLSWLRRRLADRS
jgi:Ser/Thr protein kinase RdoA (MazF antagonist)